MLRTQSTDILMKASEVRVAFMEVVTRAQFCIEVGLSR